MIVRVKKALYQWDVNQSLIVNNASHVDYKIGNDIYRVAVSNGSCLIPDEMLQTEGEKNCWACYSDGTRIAYKFNVIGRPQPPDYVYTPTQRVTFESLVNEVEELVSDIEDKLEAGEFNGSDAKINGYNTIQMQAGENVTLEQTGNILKINAQAGGASGASKAYVDAQDVAEKTARESADSALQESINGKANAIHTHAQSDVTGLSDALAGKAASTHTHSYNDLTNKPTIPAAVTDDHIAEVAATVVPSDDITANTDARHTHSNKAFLDTVTGLKTVNGNSLIGSGDITIQGGGTSTDVQINGTSITENGVANIPIAKNGANYGVTKIGASWQTGLTTMTDGTLQVFSANSGHIDQRYPYNCGAIMPNNLDYAVKAALTDGRGAAYTDDEKAAARDRLGVDGAIDAKLGELETAVTNLEEVV